MLFFMHTHTHTHTHTFFQVFFLAHLRFPFILSVLSLSIVFLGVYLFVFTPLLPRVSFQSEDLSLSFALENYEPLFLC